jgi:hypothetical protein
LGQGYVRYIPSSEEALYGRLNGSLGLPWEGREEFLAKEDIPTWNMGEGKDGNADLDWV